jgi:transposase
MATRNPERATARRAHAEPFCGGEAAREVWYARKRALTLVRHFDVIYHDDLRVAHLLKNHQLAKSIADAGWSAFLGILSVKAACAGREVVAVDPACTSQLCSSWGALVQKGLSVRWHACPHCGLSLHRDHNSAQMIYGRAAPSGSRGGACGTEPRSPYPVGRGEHVT